MKIGEKYTKDAVLASLKNQKRAAQKAARKAIVKAKAEALAEKIAARVAKKAATVAAIRALRVREAARAEINAIEALNSLKEDFVSVAAENEAVTALLELEAETKAERRNAALKVYEERKLRSYEEDEEDSAAVVPIDSVLLFDENKDSKEDERVRISLADRRILEAVSWTKRLWKLRDSYALKFIVQIGSDKFVQCFARDNEAALSWCLRKFGMRQHVKVVDVFPVTKKEVLLRKRMLRDSSPSSQKKGMTFLKFLKKYQELLSSKKTFVVTGANGRYRNYERTCHCSSKEAMLHLLKAKGVTCKSLSLVENPLFDFSQRFSLEMKASAENLEFAVKRPEFQRAVMGGNTLKAEYILYLILSKISHRSGIPRFLREEKELREMRKRNPKMKKRSFDLPRELQEIGKLCDGSIPEYVYYAYLNGVDIPTQKYTENLGITLEEKLEISLKGVIPAMRTRSQSSSRQGTFLKGDIPDSLYKTIYKNQTCLLDEYPYLALMNKYDIDLDMGDVLKLKKLYENENFFKHREVHTACGVNVGYTFAGLVKWASRIGKNPTQLSMKDFPRILNCLLSETYSDRFPSLTINSGWESITHLDNPEKIKWAADKLQNCMAINYMSAASTGETFLFYIEYRGEIAGLEISNGKCIQLLGIKNKNVTQNMKDYVKKFIDGNPIMIKETEKYYKKYPSLSEHERIMNSLCVYENNIIPPNCFGWNG